MDQYNAIGRLGALITNITNWALGLLIAISALFIIYAAFLFLTAGGNEEQVKKAKQVIVYAIIAIAVGLLSKAIVSLVVRLIGAV